MSNFIFNHVAISVENVDASIAFYKKVLKLNEIENTASNSKTRWLSLGEGKQLHLIPSLHSEIKINKAVHFALSTKDVDAFVKHLNTLNIDYSDWKNTPSKNYIRKDGVQQVYFQDIDGYWVEVNNALT